MWEKVNTCAHVHTKREREKRICWNQLKIAWSIPFVECVIESIDWLLKANSVLKIKSNVHFDWFWFDYDRFRVKNWSSAKFIGTKTSFYFSQLSRFYMIYHRYHIDRKMSVYCRCFFCCFIFEFSIASTYREWSKHSFSVEYKSI